MSSWGYPATSSPSNFRKLSQKLFLHILGMDPGFFFLPGGGEKRALGPSFHCHPLPQQQEALDTSTPASPGAAGPWLLHCHGLHPGLIDLVDDDIPQLTHELQEAQERPRERGQGIG